MSSAKTRSLFTALASAALVATTMLVGASAAADEHDEAPAPENLRLVTNNQDRVERLEWDPPNDSSEPERYDVSYRFANEGQLGEQFFWWTRNTFLEASGTFGHFVECTPRHRPSQEWIVWITYPTSSGDSQRSNQVSMCLP